MSVDPGRLRHVRIVGSGLIGTSIGLALRKSGILVTMVDSNRAAATLAQDLMGQEAPSDASAALVDVVLIATPSSAVTAVIDEEIKLNLNSTFMDVASIKSKPKNEVTLSALPSQRFLPTHPMAGREVGGAESARGDLFQGCIWAYDPDGVDPQSLALGLSIITACGATPLAISAQKHDDAVAVASHLPQAVSTLLARQLLGSESGFLDLAGGGLRDTTRIAASSPGLWSEILSANASALRPLLVNLQNDLAVLIEKLDDPKYLLTFMEGGNRGRAMIPGKHGSSSRDYTYLPVVIEDKPGQLAALFEECAKANVNVEDLTIEHSPEQFTGLITLALSSDDAEKLFLHLENAGWKVHSPR
jgi:prephenate dehydrogenase